MCHAPPFRRRVDRTYPTPGAGRQERATLTPLGGARCGSDGNGYRLSMTDDSSTPEPEASERATQALERQRDRHQPDDTDIDDEGVGALVNNTGLDGDAASG